MNDDFICIDERSRSASGSMVAFPVEGKNSITLFWQCPKMDQKSCAKMRVKDERTDGKSVCMVRGRPEI